MTEVAAARVALVGVPNCGKTALFNALTGSRQKVGNYAGVTVERKIGSARTPAGRRLDVIDLPGTYSLRARSPDEEVTRDVVMGRRAGEPAPDLLVAVADATNMRSALRLVLELKETGRPILLVLNMIDIATYRGIGIDAAKLEAELGIPVVTATAVRKAGMEALFARLDRLLAEGLPEPAANRWQEPSAGDLRAAQRAAD
ncbi:MAG: 50S ribosome-binding GTPase, partial [Paracoccaceae bacterium]|nr:50S ribosome-binding GTPase [Paracoccaceae bacterium]